ncbi:hypothetical protein F5B22DRAFT_642166 [Xylaria bambusicola]|uniref:uncharacterized protein n=1 Tax=Xylaria bambusicola TaxID=326684 RepID=UPI0020089DBE|nr:uncharacterized protein F5B22DRAFT_642166 [Xylaria bambusicola]KAI0526009.1 hypothetical protein F5B22DRAFT_642166 [Xylaria bambusicola]
MEYSMATSLWCVLSPSTGIPLITPPAEIAYQFHSPNWSEWDVYATRWSTYAAPSFDYVFLPETERDLSIGLEYLSANCIPLLVQGGGHGYSPSLGTKRDVVQVNLDRFDNIEIHSDGTVSVGGSVRFEDLVTSLYKAGRVMSELNPNAEWPPVRSQLTDRLRNLAVGSCPCVGSTGAMLGGGVGRLQGKYGLTSDVVQKFRILLWNGTVVEASDSVNSNLFWGMQGAGHNFGIVTETIYRTWLQENSGTHYSADQYFTDDSLHGVLQRLNTIIANQDPGLGIKTGFSLSIVYQGGTESGRLYADIFASTPANASHHPMNRVFINETVVPWSQLDFVASNGTIATACNKGLKQNAYSASLRAFDPSTFVELYAAYRSFIAANPTASLSYMVFEVFGQQAVNSRVSELAAFPHRGKINVLALLVMVYQDDAVAEVSDKFGRTWRDVLLQPEISGYGRPVVYQNYAHGDEPLAAVYGYEVWRQEKLTALKRKFDPHEVFSGYHGIPVELSGWA